MRQILTEEDYLTFAPASGGFRLYAATQRSADLLGVTHEQIGDGRATMLTNFPTAAPSFHSANIRLDRDQVRQLRSQPSVYDMQQ